mmetsp:Transcript_24551/g.82436  ORF Transcript_24551/g.82436 Transcript_24551/m.82436 type:complete len:237 (+) Transcript_24551:836-1546(+)
MRSTLVPSQRCAMGAQSLPPGRRRSRTVRMPRKEPSSGDTMGRWRYSFSLRSATQCCTVSNWVTDSMRSLGVMMRYTGSRRDHPARKAERSAPAASIFWAPCCTYLRSVATPITTLPAEMLGRTTTRKLRRWSTICLQASRMLASREITYFLSCRPRKLGMRLHMPPLPDSSSTLASGVNAHVSSRARAGGSVRSSFWEILVKGSVEKDRGRAALETAGPALPPWRSSRPQVAAIK